uniref:Uncharacterized protein n=1 Tax=Arundo donax TaxID=35708 RepID=A0A0A9G6N3_ARUDO
MIELQVRIVHGRCKHDRNYKTSTCKFFFF